MSLETMRKEDLYTYQGTNPTPDDFDEFWNRQLEKVSLYTPKTFFIPAKVQFRSVKCYDLFFDGLDGARIHAQFLEPETTGRKMPVIFLFHGYTGNAGDWWEKLAWVQQGFAVAALDCRGQAGKSEDISRVKGLTCTGQFIRGILDDPEKLLFKQIFLDTVILVDIIKKRSEIDKERMAVHGGSQGGALALVCAALRPEIKKAAVLYPFLSDYQRVYELDCRQSAYEELYTFFRAFDPLHEKKEEYFKKLGYIDVQNFAGRIKADILWAAALKDETCPVSTQFAVYNKIKSRKRMLIYPDFGHEAIPGFIDQSFGFMQELLRF